MTTPERPDDHEPSDLDHADHLDRLHAAREDEPDPDIDRAY
jgi:hypothetical protein